LASTPAGKPLEVRLRPIGVLQSFQGSGRTPSLFSKVWKISHGFFQGLEKFVVKTSNGWKKKLHRFPMVGNR